MKFDYLRLPQSSDTRGNKTLTRDWSPGGLLNMVQDGDGHRTDYLYDSVGRLIGVWAPNFDYLAFSHDAGGRLTEKWFPNGTTAHCLTTGSQ
jgi:YD repeat-containing protein